MCPIVRYQIGEHLGPRTLTDKRPRLEAQARRIRRLRPAGQPTEVYGRPQKTGRRERGVAFRPAPFLSFLGEEKILLNFCLGLPFALFKITRQQTAEVRPARAPQQSERRPQEDFAR